MVDLKLTNGFPPATEQDILELEQSLALRLPEDYKEFLSKHNGGYTRGIIFNIDRIINHQQYTSELDEFAGVKKNMPNDIRSWKQSYIDRIPENMYPIASDAAGNKICISLYEKDWGYIYFWDHEQEKEDDEGNPIFENLYLMAYNFKEFADSWYLYEENIEQ